MSWKKAVALVVSIAFLGLAFTGCLGTHSSSADNENGASSIIGKEVAVHLDRFYLVDEDAAYHYKNYQTNLTLTNTADHTLDVALLKAAIVTTSGSSYDSMINFNGDYHGGYIYDISPGESKQYDGYISIPSGETPAKLLLDGVLIATL